MPINLLFIFKHGTSGKKKSDASLVHFRSSALPVMFSWVLCHLWLIRSLLNLSPVTVPSPKLINSPKLLTEKNCKVLFNSFPMNGNTR